MMMWMLVAKMTPTRVTAALPRKGMVMVSPQVDPQCCYEFEGEILVLHHPTTISTKYQVPALCTLSTPCTLHQAMVHCGSIRQTASIIRY